MTNYPNNFYQNYPYGNIYSQGYQQLAQNFLNQYPQQTTQQLNNGTPQVPIQGKIVDGEDVVKATEVPFGGFGIFPKGDMSEIYLKTWNENGSTKITTFKPIELDEVKTETITNNNEILLEKMKEIENKIDKITEKYEIEENKKEEKKVIVSDYKKEGVKF